MKAIQGATTKSFIVTVALIAACLIGLTSPGKASAAYPEKPIDLVVAFAAGATNDTGARLVADYLGKKWGVQINVINKPGGNGVPAVTDVMTAKPDGYTMLFDLNQTSSVQSALMKTMPYKMTDRTFVCPGVTGSRHGCCQHGKRVENDEGSCRGHQKVSGRFQVGNPGKCIHVNAADRVFP